MYLFLDIVASDPDADVHDIVASIRSIDTNLDLSKRTTQDSGYGISTIRLLLDVGEEYDTDSLISRIQEIDTVYSVTVVTSYTT